MINNKTMAKKRPLCLVDKVVSAIAEHPQEALEQNILKYDNDFWRKVYEKTYRLFLFNKNATQKDGSD